MLTLPAHNTRRSPQLQNRGAALLVVLLLILTIFATSLVGALSSKSIEIQRQKKSLDALKQAKRALIAWSVLQGDLGTTTNPRPGTLPCPDVTNTGTHGSSCSLAGSSTIGRIPWKTLGIEELRDANGEQLWYAISNSFRRPGLSNAPINSDSQGTLLLYAADGATLLTPSGEELVAIIFSAGLPLPGQDRNAGPNSAASYLDSGNGRNNAAAGGPFILGPVTDAQGDMIVNDLVLGISARELIASIEKRVLREAQDGLSKFASANGGKFPNPSSSSCTLTITSVATPNTCDSDSTICFGRLPENVLSPHVADWFIQNGWGRTMTYAVDKNDALDGSGSGCSTALTTDGHAKSYVVITPGLRRAGQTRPSTSLTDYLDDSANSDAWSADPDFSTPIASSNDQLRSLP